MTSKIVVDTSVIIKWLNKTNEQHIEKADKLMESALAGTTVLIAPELSKYEIGNVLLTGKKLNPREANVSLGTSYSLPVTFITESEDLAKETFKIAYKSNITYYDASFLSLAKKYKATLVTENIKHQGRAKGIKTTALKDYKI